MAVCFERRRTQLADTLEALTTAGLEDLVLAAAALLDVPATLVAFREADRRWVKVSPEAILAEDAYDLAFYAIDLLNEEPLVATEGAWDTRFAAFPHRADSAPALFVGAPIVFENRTVGTLCGFGEAVRTGPSPRQLRAFAALARQVGVLLAAQLDARRLARYEKEHGALVAAVGDAERETASALASALRFEQLFANLPIACYTFDAQATIHEWNVTAEELWGIPGHTAFLRSVYATAGYVGSLDAAEEMTRRVLAGESIYGEERLVVGRDGRSRWLVSNTLPLRNRQGEIVGGMSAQIDVTERKRMEEELREAKLFAESICENSTSFLYLLDLQTDALTWTNRDLGAFLGYDAEAVASMGGMALARVTPPRDRSVFADHLAGFGDALDGEEREIELRARHADGSERWFWHRHRVYRRNSDGSPSILLGTAQDISERKRMADVIRANEARFRAVLESLHEGLVVEDAEEGIVLHNRSAERILGLTGDELVGRATRDPRWQTVRPDGSPFPGSEQPISIALETGEAQPTTIVGVRRPDGDVRWISVNATPVLPKNGQQPAASVASFLDVTERLEQERFIQEQVVQIREYSAELERQKRELEAATVRLEALATTDGLTGLKNHRYFQEALRARIDDRPPGETLSLALLDVDRFKGYNDEFGHPAGDAVLRRVAEVLAGAVRPSDLAARYGGEEFVAVMPGLDAEAAMALTENLRIRLEATPLEQGTLTASFGVATLERELADAEALIKAADDALYRSKEAGRNRATHHRSLPKAA